MVILILYVLKPFMYLVVKSLTLFQKQNIFIYIYYYIIYKTLVSLWPLTCVWPLTCKCVATHL